jgi:5,5'-dehydrodivanillate O-demethylase oxygenase subunit
MSNTHAPTLEQLDVARSGPDTLTGRFLRQFWTPVALLDDVLPGRARPITIMNERFTYYRGESGEPHLVGFFCAHRSTQMSTGWVEGEDIRCFYHGWKYDGTGQCIEQPAERETYAAKVRIEGYPTKNYLGLVFAYLGNRTPPEFPLYPIFDGPGRLFSRSFTRNSNYFNALENSCDQVHVNFVHRNSEFAESGMTREIPKIDAFETDYGVRREVRFSDGALRIAHMIMPVAALVTIYERQAGMVQHLAYRIPINDQSHVSFNVDLVNLPDDKMQEYLATRAAFSQQVASLTPSGDVVAAALRGDLHLDDLDRPDIVFLQDDVALSGQPPIGHRPHDRLGQSDAQIIELRKVYTRELRAFEQGNPLKAWTVPYDLVATS